MSFVDAVVFLLWAPLFLMDFIVPFLGEVNNKTIGHVQQQWKWRVWGTLLETGKPLFLG